MSDFLGPAKVTKAGLDADITAKINDVGSAARGALNATYAAASKPFAVTRDADGKVSGITDNGIAETYTRDASGKVATIVRAGQTITLQRDADGKITGGI
jgi:YD repeat-containing protein